MTSRRRHLLDALRVRGFRRLLATRLAGQFGDGVFQASLAGAVLFNPERQAQPAQVAAGFAVLLLPYSLLGPFAGVLLDRWWRQRVLVVANVVRAAGVLMVAGEIAGGWSGSGFYLSTLVIFSLTRFVLSALGASLPRVLGSGELVTANAVSTTTGALVGAAGGGSAIAARALLGNSNAGYALVAAAAAVPFLLAAAAARGFACTALGPAEHERCKRESLAEVGRGLTAGLRHVCARPPARNALAAIGVHRLMYGVTTVCLLLLYRNYFSDDGVLRAGLAGLAQVITALAAGGALAAAVTPAAYRRFGAVRWPAALLGVGAVVQIVLVLPYRLALMLPAALLLGFVAQSVKISVDSLLQREVADEFRGRVFALYDALFNVAVVTAAVLTAAVLPADGRSPASVIVLAVGYAVTALLYAGTARRTARVPAVTEPSRTTAQAH